MADGVSLPATGVTAATDDCGAAGHAQIVKLGIATDGSATPFPGDATTGLRASRGTASASLSNVNDSAASASLLASNSSRRGAIVVNDSPSILYLKYGATASLTSFTYRIEPYGTWEMPEPVYTGAIDGIWSADASGAARITELT